MLPLFASLAFILIIYHAFALLANFLAAKTLLCSGHYSILFALLDKELMVQSVKFSLSRIVRHTVWCIALIIFLNMLL